MQASVQYCSTTSLQTSIGLNSFVTFELEFAVRSDDEFTVHICSISFTMKLTKHSVSAAVTLLWSSFIVFIGPLSETKLALQQNTSHCRGFNVTPVLALSLNGSLRMSEVDKSVRVLVVGVASHVDNSSRLESATH